MNSVSLDHPRSRSTFRTVKVLVGSYLSISVLTLVAIILMRHDTAAVNTAVWIRGTIVVGSAVLMTSFAVRAARGSGRAYLRLRLVSVVMVVAIAVIVALPGTFPLWMKIEQSVCGLVLLTVVYLVNGKHMRSVFTVKS